MDDKKTPALWPVCGDSPADIQKFVGQAWPRLAPDSDADSAERAFLTGQLLGLVMRLVTELERGQLARMLEHRGPIVVPDR